jgi:hypothetical protein
VEGAEHLFTRGRATRVDLGCRFWVVGGSSASNADPMLLAIQLQELGDDEVVQLCSVADRRNAVTKRRALAAETDLD